MREHCWILDVLRDLGNYASTHGLPEIKRNVELSRQAFLADQNDRSRLKLAVENAENVVWLHDPAAHTKIKSVGLPKRTSERAST